MCSNILHPNLHMEGGILQYFLDSYYPDTRQYTPQVHWIHTHLRPKVVESLQNSKVLKHE
jgi:hypothetical protein